VIAASHFRGKRYAVLGLARSGRATVAALAASGAHVFAWDDNQGHDAQISAAEIVDLHSADFAALGLDALVLSPGVPLNTHPLATKARAANVPIIGDIELFAQARAELPPHRVVGITGTNGKSTTTALIHHILATAGIEARMGGNIGLPILGQPPLGAGGVYVLELSSFQIDLTQSLACDVAVLLNITPDHLDRHGDLAGYAAAKERLFTMQRAADVAVIAVDDALTRAIADRATARVVRVSASDIAMVDQQNWPSLQGPHNAQNVAAAVAAVRALGVGEEVIGKGLASYPGLPHRMERVDEIGGVLFVNDSKATNPTSSAPALAAYPAIHWILGGYAKTDELDACLPHLGHVRAAYTIGKAGPMFARLLSDKVAHVVEAQTLDNAVALAAAAAGPGDVVLLSPACASYDQFTDFEARGRAFVQAVEALPR